MPSVSLQFHAAPSEHVSILQSCARGFDLHFAIEDFGKDYRVSPLSSSGLSVNPGKRSRIFVSPLPFVFDVVAARDFLKANPRFFVVTPGILDDEGLRESQMGAVTDNPTDLKTWGTIKRRAVKSMHRGAYVVDGLTGVRELLKSHRYTDGAKELALSGTRMLASIGWNRYEFPIG